MEPRVTAEMNKSISKSFTRLEVEEAIKQMAPLKSPSLYGFRACFYQNQWSIITDEVCQVVLSLLNGNIVHPLINHTYLALIPQVKCLEHVSEYRPISICNVLYKIMSKTIANKFKKVLSAIISSTQSVFLPKTDY